MRKGVSPNPQQALDYFEAVEYYFQQGLTDGLPVVPPPPTASPNSSMPRTCNPMT